MSGFWAIAKVPRAMKEEFNLVKDCTLFIEIIEDRQDTSYFISELKKLRSTGMYGIIDATDFQIKCIGMRVSKTNYAQTEFEGKFELTAKCLGERVTFFSTGEAFADSYSYGTTFNNVMSTILNAKITMNSSDFIKTSAEDFEEDLDTLIKEKASEPSIRSSFSRKSFWSLLKG